MKITKKPKFYKRVLVLSLIFLGLTLSGIVRATDINWAAFVNGGTANINIVSGHHIRYVDLSQAGLINDEDDNTRYYVYQYHDWIDAQITYEAIIIFNNPVNLNKIEYIRESVLVAAAATEKTYLYYSGSWQGPIYTRSASGAKSKEVINGDWINVERMKVVVSIAPGEIGHISSVHGVHSLYELRAFGPLQDIGLRVFNGTEIVAIAAEIGPATSPLRIAKNGVVYGIALIDQGSPEYGDPLYDSGVRIQTSSGIKALRRL